MKNQKCILLFAFVLTLVLTHSSSVFGADRSANRLNVQLTELAKINVKDSENSAWILNYENGQKQVRIGIEERQNRVIYHVSDGYVQVDYISNHRNFGVKRYQSIFAGGDAVEVINRSEALRQSILVDGQVNRQEALGLISVYFRDLLNPEFR